MSSDNYRNNSPLVKLHHLTLKFRDKDKVIERFQNGQQQNERKSDEDAHIENEKRAHGRAAFRFNSTPIKKQHPGQMEFKGSGELDKVSEIDSSMQVSNRARCREKSIPNY